MTKKLAIAREEILAFGDSYNDLPLLHYAGMGVAVENACLALRTEADEICPQMGRMVKHSILKGCLTYKKNSI